MLRIYSATTESASAICGMLTSGLSRSQRRIGMFGMNSIPLLAASSPLSFCVRSVSSATSFRQRVHRSHRCCRALISCRQSSTALRYSSIATCRGADIGTIQFRESDPARLSCICCASSTSTSLDIAIFITTKWLFTCRPHILTLSAERRLLSSTMREFYSVRRSNKVRSPFARIMDDRVTRPGTNDYARPTEPVVYFQPHSCPAVPPRTLGGARPAWVCHPQHQRHARHDGGGC